MLWKLLSTGLTLKVTVFLQNMLLQSLLLLEPTLALVALEIVHLILLMLVHMKKHGLGTSVGLPAPEVFGDFLKH